MHIYHQAFSMSINTTCYVYDRVRGTSFLKRLRYKLTGHQQTARHGAEAAEEGK